ncbi:MAG TPA: hypothetical protein VHC69_19435 [Polyangiaceae bacterium]|nr:hypothetical protein [Polyangiaceae bacterium]
MPIPQKPCAKGAVVALGVLAFVCTTRTAPAAPKRGEFLQTDTLGVSLVSRDLTTGTTKTVSDATNLSEYVGLHYYALDRVRFGMNIQLTERLTPPPPLPQSRVQRFAFLPQVGWNFYDPFFAALVLVFAPRSDGQPKLALGVNVLAGVAIPLSKVVSLSVAAEVPYTYYQHQSIALTGLAGVAFRF